MIHFATRPKFVGRQPAFCRRLLWLSALLVLVAGCGKAGPKGPQGTVHGKVTVKGTAVPAGTVVSFQDETGAGASALAGADGSYRLLGSNGDKVRVGSYKVVVMPAQKEPTLTPEEQMEASMKAQLSGTTLTPDDDAAIPTKYRSMATTPESREVKEGDNEINIDLAE